MSQSFRDAAATDPARVVVQPLADDGTSPNNGRCALLVYRGVVDLVEPDPAVAFERRFADNDWGGGWRNGVFPFHHFHSNAHEVLGIYAGSATVCFGGMAGVELTVAAGDVVIIPAGVAHKAVRDHGGFACVGAYPHGAAPDLCRSDGRDHGARLRRIAAVARPRLDPVYGESGPMLAHWPG